MENKPERKENSIKERLYEVYISKDGTKKAKMSLENYNKISERLYE